MVLTLDRSYIYGAIYARAAALARDNQQTVRIQEAGGEIGEKPFVTLEQLEKILREVKESRRNKG